MYILGIESSCDETSAAVLCDGKIVANRIYSQKVHAEFGGVVPEIASRAHIRKVDRLCGLVLDDAGIKMSDIGLVAVADQPGLAGALLVGMSFALGLHTGYKIPVTGVNHLEGHIASVRLENDVAFPFLALVVSGGHTAIYKVEGWGKQTILGQTVDDAAGEAFDKVGKLLGLSYPAGRPMEEAAATFDGTQKLIPFPVAKIDRNPLDFSFSGLKTSVKYHVEKLSPEEIEKERPRICASFQKAVVDSLTKNMIAASRETGISRVALVGGVACNGALRAGLKAAFGDNVFFPVPALCTDNAAMIALAGWENWREGRGRFPSMKPTQARGQTKAAT